MMDSKIAQFITSGPLRVKLRDGGTRATLSFDVLDADLISPRMMKRITTTETILVLLEAVPEEASEDAMLIWKGMRDTRAELARIIAGESAFPTGTAESPAPAKFAESRYEKKAREQVPDTKACTGGASIPPQVTFAEPTMLVRFFPKGELQGDGPWCIDGPSFYTSCGKPSPPTDVDADFGFLGVEGADDLRVTLCHVCFHKTPFELPYNWTVDPAPIEAP